MPAISALIKTADKACGWVNMLQMLQETVTSGRKMRRVFKHVLQFHLQEGSIKLSFCMVLTIKDGVWVFFFNLIWFYL